MRKQTSHGTPEQMLAAFESKLAQLGGQVDVESATQVEASNRPYGPYGRADAIAYLNGKLEFYGNEIEMDFGDGLKLAKYLKKQGKQVYACPSEEIWSIPGQCHWTDCYFYPYDAKLEGCEDNTLWDGESDIVESATDLNDGGILNNEMDYVTSGKEVQINPGDEEITYSDPQGAFGELGSRLTLEEIKSYWNANYDGDPSLMYYDTFDAWWKDTRQWLTSIKGSSELESDDTRDAYLDELIAEVDARLPEAGVKEFIVEKDDAGNDALFVIVPDNGFATEFAVPDEDLKWDDVDTDANYIVNEILNQIQDTMDTVESSTDWDDEDEYEDDVESYGFVEIASKQVEDADGFMTDYTMYRDKETGEYVFVFGDKDMYTPEQGDFDWSCDTEQEAWEWYNDYHGFGEAEDEDDLLD